MATIGTGTGIGGCGCVGALYEAVFVESKQTGCIQERHRHRFEVNPEYVAALEERGIRFVGHDETHARMEILELNEQGTTSISGVYFLLSPC